MHINTIPIFDKIKKKSKNILIAGAGGGFDIYSGIPIYLALRKMGYSPILSNYSFIPLEQTSAEKVSSVCYEIKEDTEFRGSNYFPERHLKRWLKKNNFDTNVYAFDRTGVLPLITAYNRLITMHTIDTVILVDGGTDSLMFGDEESLGTPQEDACSIAAVFGTNAPEQYLINLGFGVDHFHGVSHYLFLENIAQLMKDGGYLGSFQLLPNMEEGRLFQKLINSANKAMPYHESIVANSISSALEGDYGNIHKTDRTKGSTLWINPLMTLYWAFELRSIVAHLKYYDDIKDAFSMGDINKGIFAYRNRLNKIRKNKQIPI